MKLINLLNKIANGEEIPQEIRYKHKEYKWVQNVDYKEKNENNFLLSEECINETFLNEKVEIIEEEEKEIEKLDIDKNDIAWCEGNMKTDEEMVDIILNIKDKINELIDAVNEMRKEK